MASSLKTFKVGYFQKVGFKKHGSRPGSACSSWILLTWGRD